MGLILVVLLLALVFGGLGFRVPPVLDRCGAPLCLLDHRLRPRQGSKGSAGMTPVVGGFKSEECVW